MGYSNYWYQDSDFTDEEWELVTKEAKYLEELGIDIDIMINDIYIDGDCEMMHLRRYRRTQIQYAEDNLSFHCCKTRMQKYDLAVWYLLTFCKNIKDDFGIGRDR